MTRLDYVLLAEHARVDPGGTLSVLGGSFSKLDVPTLPTTIPLAVAGRVLTDDHTDPLRVRLSFAAPGPEGSGSHSFTVSFETEVGPPQERVDGVPAAVTFAIAGGWPLPTEGLYVLTVQVEDGEPVELTFRVVVAATGGRNGA